MTDRSEQRLERLGIAIAKAKAQKKGATKKRQKELEKKIADLEDEKMLIEASER